MEITVYTAQETFTGVLVQDPESPEGVQGEALRAMLGLERVIVMVRRGDMKQLAVINTDHVIAVSPAAPQPKRAVSPTPRQYGYSGSSF